MLINLRNCLLFVTIHKSGKTSLKVWFRLPSLRIVLSRLSWQCALIFWNSLVFILILVRLLTKIIFI